MLLNNGTPFGRLTPVSGPLRCNGLLRNAKQAMLRENAMGFGSRTSIPQGYQSAYKAIVPTLQDTEYMAVRMLGEGAASYAGQGAGNMATQMVGEGSTTFAGQMGGTLGVQFDGEGAFGLAIEGVGVLAVAMDAGARPSAYDVAQEVRLELQPELQNIRDMAQLHGLVVGTDLIVTETTRSAGSISQTINTAGGVTIVQRQP